MNVEETIRRWNHVYNHGYATHRRDTYSRRVLHCYLSTIPKPISLIDIGCGYCYFLDVYLQYCDQVCLVDAVDLSSCFEGLDNVHFIKCNVVALTKYVKKQYDVVIASKLLHSIPWWLHDAVVSQMSIVTKSTGTAIVSVASVNDPARNRADIRVSASNIHEEYITGVKHGCALYRYYFIQEEIRSLLQSMFEIQSVTEFSAGSGWRNHQDRVYWMLLLRKKPMRLSLPAT